jgi:hypothetical protein
LQRLAAIAAASTTLFASAAAYGEPQNSTVSKIVVRSVADSELRQPEHFAVESNAPTVKPATTVDAVEVEPQAGIRQPLSQPAPAASPNAEISALYSSLPIGPIDPATYFRMRAESQSPNATQVNYQIDTDTPAEAKAAEEAAQEEATFDASIAKNPCAGMPSRPYNEYGINIAMPQGELPTDFASACWDSINSESGHYAGMRFWGTTTFAWNATCLCHRPLYFEQVNLERYGYGCCCEALQPAASAAHFFGTIPTLPYCIATECPGDCDYTLGHYRPGSCPPYRWEWPLWTTRGALAEGGVWTGMIFLIP